MGLFDHFPYTNVHELNLDWVLSMMKALEAEWNAFTAGNSLQFADPMLHDISKTYAKNTIVLDGNGNAYVSLQAVPVGVGLQNGDYWLMVFDYEAFIEKVNKNFTVNYYRGSYRAASAMVIGDWLTVDDILYKATAAIAVDDVLEDGVNITHFTLEDFIKAFMQSANQTIQQYKDDIDASELQYRNQLAQDIADTTASLQAQLDAAISGATVDSEVINARVGDDGTTYGTLGDAIRTQFSNMKKVIAPLYDDTATYNFGDVVIYLKDYYFCIHTISTAEAFTASNWKKMPVSELMLYMQLEINGIDSGRMVLTELLATPGAISSSNGVESNSSSALANYHRTFYVRVHKDDTVYYHTYRATGLYLLAYYDDDGTFVDGVLGGGSALTGTYTIPDDGYIRMCNRNVEIAAGAYAYRYTPDGAAAQSIINVASNLVPLANQSANILSIVNSEFLPSFWETYLATKIPELRAKDALIGNNGDSFIFVTDVHVPRNRMRSPVIFKRLFKETALKKLINGGDSLDINTGASGKADAIEVMDSWKAAVYGLHEIECRGNHDDNNYNSSNDPANVLTAEEWYGIMLKPLEDKYTLTKETHYIVDNETQKMRYIILDSEGDSTDFNNNLNYMASRLAELDNSWTAIVIIHRYWDSVGNVASRGSALQTKINSIYGSLNCAFAGVLTGHLHADDEVIDPTYGYPIVGVCCDTRSVGNSGYDRSVNTKNEHCFDVAHIDFTNRKLYLTRIGAGDDVLGGGTGVREYNY